MGIKRLADDDSVGNKAAHFFKSGNIMRTPENDNLIALKELLPEKGNWGTPIEYDVWYDIAEEEIKGYTYTDVFSKFLLIRVASVEKYHRTIRLAAKEPITEEGERIFAELRDSSHDKYRLRKRAPKHKFVIFLPGTNILNKVLDIPKTKRAVAQGAVLKCHPLTAPGMFAWLKKEFGKDNVIAKKLSGHQLLESADIVGCCTNSEMGLLALAKGKTVYLFDEGSPQTTYGAFYKAIWEGRDYPNILAFKAILSCKYSGLVPYFIDNPQERIDYFFNFWKANKHAIPRPRK